MTRTLKLLFVFYAIFSSATLLADEKKSDTLQAKFLPPDGKQLLIVGQDLDAVGGVKHHTDGYFENVSPTTGGVTTYTSLPSLSGLKTLANWGAGDVCGQLIVDSPNYKQSALAIGLYMVDQLPAINAGTHDAKIQELARWVGTTNRPVFLRIGYEFDGYWNHYDPGEYKKAFRRTVDQFRKLNITNCAFVWQAGTSPVDDAVEKKHENIGDWYPGDDYVDWCGLSWFLSTKKQLELSDELLEFARNHRKPTMICESAPQSYDIAKGSRANFNTMIDGKPGENKRQKTADEIWAEWFVPYFDYVHKNQDTIRAVAYINVNWDAQPMWGKPYKEGYWGNSRVDANPKIMKRWLKEISKPAWVHSSLLQLVK